MLKKLLLIFIIGLFHFSCTSPMEEVTLGDFTSGTLDFRDFKKVAYFNQNQVRIGIRTDSLKLKRHESVRNINDEYHYVIPVDSIQWRVFSDTLLKRQYRIGQVPSDSNYLFFTYAIDVKEVLLDYFRSGQFLKGEKNNN